MKDMIIRDWPEGLQPVAGAPGWVADRKAGGNDCEHCGVSRPQSGLWRCWYRYAIWLPNLVGQAHKTHTWYLCAACTGQLEQLTALAALAGDIYYGDDRA
jgi:hypothetical protein